MRRDTISPLHAQLPLALDQGVSRPEVLARAQDEEPRAAGGDRPATAAQTPGETGPPSVEPLAPPAATRPEGAEWDVVVVGGGIGGLTAAALLAKAGRSVLLLEASGQLGGACLGVAPDGHRYDVGAGVLTGVGAGGSVAALCERLGVTLPAIACDPAIQVALPGHRVDLASSVDGWWPEIQREFPEEEAGWHALVSDMTSLAADRDRLAAALPPLPAEALRDRLRCWQTLAVRRWRGETRRATQDLRRAAGTPFRETLEEHGLGTASRQTLEACLWYLALRDSAECSTLEAAVALQRLREGVAVISRGPAALADLLADCVGKHGGEIRTRTAVARCVVARGRIVGVTTEAGETIRARWVVAAVPPRALLGTLLPPSPRWLRRPRLPEGPWDPSHVAQALGVTIPEAFLPSALGWLCLIVQDSARPARDENVVFIRRVCDRRGGDAADGLARLCAGRFVPPSAPASEEAIEGALLGALDRLIPGVGTIALHGWIGTAPALGKLWGRPMGAVRYTAETREWLGRRGSPHRVGWPGLLAVGEWTYPGRLVSDVVEGAMQAADAIAAAG